MYGKHLGSRLHYNLWRCGGMQFAGRIIDNTIQGTALCDAITRNRFYTQLIGMISVFVTSLWGMYQNLSLGVFG